MIIRYQELSASGKPRFPVFMRIREGNQTEKISKKVAINKNDHFFKIFQKFLEKSLFEKKIHFIE